MMIRVSGQETVIERHFQTFGDLARVGNEIEGEVAGPAMKEQPADHAGFSIGETGDEIGVVWLLPLGSQTRRCGNSPRAGLQWQQPDGSGG